jgi:5'-3' exonuclease
MYKYIIVDSVNLGYKVFNNSEHAAEIANDKIKIGNKRVFRTFIRKYIETMTYLENKYLSDDGEVIFLFDNYTSREELKELLKPLGESEKRKKVSSQYKSSRVAASLEFYNSMDLIRYYYTTNLSKYHNVRIPNLEADDLVKPCLDFLGLTNGDFSSILITNDSDWCRYLSDHVDYLPDLYQEPVNRARYTEIHKYDPTEESIILDKILNGDNADNITAVFPEFSGKQKLDIIQKFGSILEFMYQYQNYPEYADYGQMIKEREQDIRLAYQMLASIPVTPEHFKAVWVTGRNSETIQNTLNPIIFVKSDEEKNVGFEFGGLKVPRADPKE